MNIQFERKPAPNKRDFKVMIDGEHRATFRSSMRYGRTGYSLEDTNGDDISLYKHNRYCYRAVTKAEFTEVIKSVIASIPSIAEQEMARLHDEARRENQKRNDDIINHRAQVRREVLSRALELFLEEPNKGNTTAEEQEMARKLLKEYNGPLSF